MNVFKIDFDRLIHKLKPSFLTDKWIYYFLRAALMPLKDIHYQFEKQRELVNMLLKYDTSKRNVEIVLCKKFGDGIYIENTSKQEPLYLSFYLPAYIVDEYKTQAKTAYLNQYIDFYLDETIKTVDFTIYVPYQILNEIGEKDISEFADLFVLPSFKYNIVGY